MLHREWRTGAAAGAVAAGMAFGMRDAFGHGDEDDDPVVVEAPDPGDLPVERITLYLHPDVPEASLAVLRPWVP